MSNSNVLSPIFLKMIQVPKGRVVILQRGSMGPFYLFIKIQLGKIFGIKNTHLTHPKLTSLFQTLSSFYYLK